MDNQYMVRRAAADDLPAIADLYASARKFMAERGNPNQWGDKNPPLALLREDIQKGNLYVLTSGGTIHGVFAFIRGEDPTYKRIYEGAWHSDAPYATIHRVAGDGSGGIFSACVRYCLRQCNYLRVDTHHDNLPMQRAIAKAGFRKCGVIYIADGSPRIAYDLI